MFAYFTSFFSFASHALSVAPAHTVLLYLSMPERCCWRRCRRRRCCCFFFTDRPLSLDVLPTSPASLLSWLCDGETPNNCIYQKCMYMCVVGECVPVFMPLVPVLSLSLRLAHSSLPKHISCAANVTTTATTATYEPPKYGKLCVGYWQVCASFQMTLNSAFPCMFAFFFLGPSPRWLLCTRCIVKHSLPTSVFHSSCASTMPFRSDWSLKFFAFFPLKHRAPILCICVMWPMTRHTCTQI